MLRAFFPDLATARIKSAEAVMLKSLEDIPKDANRAKYRQEAAEYSLAITRYLDNPTEHNLNELAGEMADVLITGWKAMKDIPGLEQRVQEAFEEKIKRLYWRTVRAKEESGDGRA